MDVPVSALRAELKSWIERAKDGEDITITDRGVPVARLTGVDSSDLVTSLIRDGVLSEPAAQRTQLPAPVVADTNAEQRGGVSGLFSRRRR